MKKIAVIGHFGRGTESLDGQTVKTKVLTKALCKHFGEENILQLDTHNWKKWPLRFMWSVITTVWKTENILILPAHNGLCVIVPLLWMASRLCPGSKLHYSVIGGWLPALLEKKSVLKKLLKTFHGIYVETQTMKLALEKQGFNNIYVMPNCKNLTVLSPDDLVLDHQEPYKLCTFSRVMKEKGIEDAVLAVKAVNAHFGRTVYTLDIFGQIDPGQTQWFEELQSKFPSEIHYSGSVPFNRSVDVLKDYFALLFPTRFYTEGIPGTIIDAYAAGVPVIAARWESFAEVVEEGVTGYGYEYGTPSELVSLMTEIVRTPERVLQQRKSCLKKARDYLPENTIDVLYCKMEGKQPCGR